MGGLRSDQAFACTAGWGDDDDKTALRFEAIPIADGACEIYTCNRVFRRERATGLVISGAPLEAVRTAVWLGTNTHP